MNLRPLSDALWRKRSRALLKSWPGLLDGDDEALHKVRVASRRIREALPILVSGGNGKVKKARRQIRRITRVLGPVRELDVALAALAKLEQERPTLGRAIEQVRERIAADRAEHRARLVEEIGRVDIKKLNRRIDALVDASDERRMQGAKDATAWRAVLAARVARRAEALRRAIDRAGSIYLPDRLHAVRVAVKKLRYAVELTQEADRSRHTRALATLRGVQNTLGRLHDLEVLGDRVRSLEGSLKPSAHTALGNLNALVRLIEDDCRELHAAYVARRDALLDVVDASASELGHALAVASPRPVRVLASRSGRTGSTGRSSAADAGSFGGSRRDGRGVDG